MLLQIMNESYIKVARFRIVIHLVLLIVININCMISKISRKDISLLKHMNVYCRHK